VLFKKNRNLMMKEGNETNGLGRNSACYDMYRCNPRKRLLQASANASASCQFGSRKPNADVNFWQSRVEYSGRAAGAGNSAVVAGSRHFKPVLRLLGSFATIACAHSYRLAPPLPPRLYNPFFSCIHPNGSSPL
jgi:hypothetical protein